ncbi:tRNA (adenosine(37)-N6)-dimethylallyltransferase MiaA [Allofranklinella schreckenbergeri]|uniref:tRNA dimethylallyltransferase n=1 Tax=Allofranklinella schreckenbergeri TaxID=1076744 RepID=A0A3M6R2W1_9BURK|nr:tRNA (adenosine(37)-N6)-dimethylallyltransferase MiaA [Allofranklinella schreckenbergeri]RMX09543.1 tRNA (adenosine(37)-N6)-dimethylallyltransferase MiaA [Allofranklinella schreckenbergeri]
MHTPVPAPAASPAPAPGQAAAPAAWLELPFLVLTGPTACGKSALALALAQALAPQCPVEIISMDSALVYRGMDIGTAKPSAAELAQAPHHLIDILEPHESYSAAAFVRDCGALVQAIVARGALPLIVGGTLLYLHAMLHGLDPLPQADPAVRAELDAKARQQGWPALHAWLAQIDPASAARLAPHDAQRIQRALEVWLISGQTLSSLQTRGQTTAETAAQTTTESAAQAADSWRANWVRQRVLSLEPAARAWLHARANQRLDAMVQAGFLDEVRRLRANPALHAQLPAIRAVGYRQAWLMLDGQLPPGQWLEQAKAATRQLAKRQLTWLRSMPTRRVLPCDTLSPAQLLAQALPLAQQLAGALPRQAH